MYKIGQYIYRRNTSYIVNAPLKRHAFVETTWTWKGKYDLKVESRDDAPQLENNGHHRFVVFILVVGTFKTSLTSNPRSWLYLI